MYKKIVTLLIILSVFMAQTIQAIDIYDSSLYEDGLGGATNSNYSGVSDISKATRDPAAQKQLVSCNTAVPAAARAISAIQTAKNDPGANNFLDSLFQELPSLLTAGSLAAGYYKYQYYGKTPAERKALRKEGWKIFAETNNISGGKKEAEESGDLAKLAKLAEQERIRTECLDSVVVSIAGNLLDRGTEEMISMVQTGNFGDPFYVQDGNAWIKNMKQKTIIDVFGSDLRARETGGILSNPYALPVARNIINAYSSQENASFQDRTKFTLGEQLLKIQNNYGYGTSINNIIPDIKQRQIEQQKALDSYSKDFNKGGWGAWFSLTQNPANNPIGYAILAQEEIEKNNLRNKEIEEIESSPQLLSTKVCTAYRKKIIKGNGDVVYQTVNERNTSIKPTDPDCVSSIVVTPGFVMTERMKSFVTSDIRRLELANRFNSSISAILTAGVNRLTKEGLDRLGTDVKLRYKTSPVSSGFSAYSTYKNTKFTNKNNYINYNNQLYSLIFNTNGSFWQSDTNLQRDLNDIQVGCEVKKGIVTTQKEYVDELAYMVDTNKSPITRYVPYLGLLDMCIPGPTPIWQDISDKWFSEYIEAMSAEDPKSLGTPDFAFSELQKKFDKKQKTADTLNTIGSFTSGFSGALPPPANFIGLAAGSATKISGALVRSSKINKNVNGGIKPDSFTLGANYFRQVVPEIMTQEADFRKNIEIEQLIQDYENYVQTIIETYEEKNIPVAAEANVLVGNLFEKDENIRNTMVSYKQEYEKNKKILEELKSIQAEVDKIYAEAKADKTLNPPFTLPDVCTKSCSVVKPPIENPKFLSIDTILAGFQLDASGNWIRSNPLRDLISKYAIAGENTINTNFDPNKVFFAAPSVDSFTSDISIFSTVPKTVELSWDTSGADDVKLIYKINNTTFNDSVAASGKKSITINKTTEFRLSARTTKSTQKQDSTLIVTCTHSSC